MAKIVIVVPNSVMEAQAESVVKSMGVDAVVLRESSKTVVETVRRQAEQGAAVAVARGNHAHLLMRETNIPVIEIILSGQNLALLFSQAKDLSGKERPTLGLVGFRNMFGDMDILSDVLKVSVKTFFAESSQEIPQAVQQAANAGVDVIIGGEIAMEEAARLGMVRLFLNSTKDSIQTAVSIAKRVLYAIDLEKNRAAEISSLFKYSFDAILKLDEKGCVETANYMAEKIFHKDLQGLRGQYIFDLLTASPGCALFAAMQNHNNVFAAVVQMKNQALVANLAAVNVDGTNRGFILSLQEFGKIDELEEQVRKERYNKGYIAEETFEKFKTRSPLMAEVAATAQQLARYDLPILIIGEIGVGKHALAECIHNASLRQRSPFVTVDCGGLSGSMQQKQFLGSGEANQPAYKGALEIAHTGTLLIEHVDRLDEYCQYQLLHVLKNACIVQPNGKMVLPVNIRVLCTTEKNLYQYMQEGRFLEPLYCMLTQLELQVPSLLQRAEDLPFLLDLFLERYSTRYHKYVRLSSEARELIFGQHWGGNILQLSLFCEKITLLASENIVTAEFVQKHLPLSFYTEKPGALREPLPVIVQNPREVGLRQALMDHHGNREAVAEALGVSKTTLWRWMKKYDVGYNWRETDKIPIAGRRKLRSAQV